MTDPASNSPDQPAGDPAGLWRGALDQARAEAEPPPGLPTLAELQAAFEEFEIVGLVGRGGMGAVYRAHDPKLGRDVAIKVLPQSLAGDPQFTERFAREARALARLQHPHVLTVHDFGERAGMHYLLTEFVDGVDLRRLMTMGKLPPEEALRIVPQICSALQFAHDHGVVHRDVKPENVLVDTQGHVRVADFGLAKMLGEAHPGPSLTATSQLVGTPHYMAPELLRGAVADHRVDIFALGVMLYEMLTGQLPVGKFAPPSKRAGTAPKLDEIVMRALEEEPEQRYQQVSEVSRDLGDQGDAPPRVARPTRRGDGTRSGDDTPPTSAGRHRRRHPRRHHRGSSRGLKIAWGMLALLVIGMIVLRTIAMQQMAEDARESNARVAQAQARYAEEVQRFDQLLAEGMVSEADRPIAPGFSMGSTPASPFPGMAILPATVLGIVLLLMISGFRTIARLRNEGRSDGAGLAVFSAWVPILLALDAVVLVPLADISDRDTRELALPLGIALCLIADIVFLAWRLREFRRPVETA